MFLQSYHSEVCAEATGSHLAWLAKVLDMHGELKKVPNGKCAHAFFGV